MIRPGSARSFFFDRLRREIAGDVLSADFDRGRYATDASTCQTFPAGVVLPKTQEDVTAAVSIAWEAGIPVTARGGGTGRGGQAVGEGLILDFSKHLTRLLTYDANAQTCIVEPGMTLSALNAALRPHRVWFPIDIASARQATIGGMAGTDAIGWRALRYGRMRDNIAAMDAVLADGGEASFGEVPEDFSEARRSSAGALILDTLEAVETHEAAIRTLPAILGAQRGYNLAALLPGAAPQNTAAFLAGSEGTLAIARRIELKLARRRGSRSLGICHFPSLEAALRAIPALLALEPTAIELAGRAIIDAGLGTVAAGDPVRRILRQDSAALLFVEFMEGNRVANARKLKELTDAMFGMRHVRAVSEVTGAAVQRASWAVRSAGLQRLYRGAGQGSLRLPVEEFAVPIARLPDAAAAFAELFAKRGMPLIWHGHVGTGALHLRPLAASGALPLIDAERMADEARALLTLFAGTPASEGGYGAERSDALQRLLGPRLGALHEQIKLRFDPKMRLNPGKIVFPPQAGEPALRRTNGYAPPALLDAIACNGNGVCRSLESGMMCPSFRVTGNERDSPRGRAGSIRLALSGELGEGAFTSDDMAETLKLCVSCKACRVECPEAVDIAAAKIAFEAARREQYPLSRFERAAAFLPHYGPRMRRWRHLLNLRDFLPWMAPLSERLTGLAADRPWPRWRREPFPGRDAIGPAHGREIVLFPDTLTAYFDVSALHAAADVLAASGFRVHPLKAPEGERPYCCGRTFLEMGLLEEAKREARRLIAAMQPFIQHGVPLVGLEPACLLTMRDEFQRVLDVEGAEQFAANARLFEEVMAEESALAVLKPQLHDIEADCLMFSHCHQRVFGTAALSKRVAEAVPGLTLREGEIDCCGMGTSFGYGPDTVAVSLQMGERALFPQIRKTGRDTLLLADGFACRKQIHDGTGRSARHVAVLLKLALLAGEKAGPGSNTDSAVKRRLARWRRRYFE
jgi:FAD/FMN-containing dehydrogenase/Fe-S oxidoreductase